MFELVYESVLSEFACYAVALSLIHIWESLVKEFYSAEEIIKDIQNIK